MAERISDRQVVKVLRPFVRAARPVVTAMRTPGRLDGLSGKRLPGSPAWAQLTIVERTQWWINRVGRLTALVTAIPGIGGALADRLPVQDAIGASAQGLLLCAIADEYELDDIGDRVRLIGWVLFDREIDPVLAAGRHEDEDAETEQLAGEFSAPTEHTKKISLKAAAGALWRMGRSLLAISGELEKRPHGTFLHRMVGALPVVGMAGDYLGERNGLKHVAKRATRWFSASRT